MTVLAQTGIVGIGPQTAKGSVATTWYRYKSLNAAMGAQEDNRISPPEIGGTPYPTGAFKAGAFFAGDWALQPRLEGDIGWLLYALCGEVSTIANSPETGMYTHIFTPLASSPSTLPWISARRLIPGTTTASDLGEIGLDVRVTAGRIVVPQNGTIVFQASLVGRVPSFDDAPTSWTWADVYEDFDSVAISVKGYFEVPDGTEVPALGLTIDVVNNFTTPPQEMIIGSYYPDDLELLSRSMVATWVYKWANPNLYKEVLANGGTGSAIPWSPVVYQNSFDLRVESPDNVTGRSNPYALKVYAPNVNWQCEPVVLTAGDMLAQRYTGTVLEPASGDYFEIHLINEVASYTWPS